MLILSQQQEQILRTLIPQLFLFGFKGTNPLELNEAGGYILFDQDMDGRPNNITSPEQVSTLNNQLKDQVHQSYRAIDCEGGIDWQTDPANNRQRFGVNRLKPALGFPPTACAADISTLVKQGKIDEAQNACDTIASVISNAGFNLVFAPVVDIAIEKDAGIIAHMNRSYGHTPELVCQCAKLFIDACKKYNIQTVLKHYPGHGSVATDSHTQQTDITDTWSENELEPYHQLANETGAVMSAHVIHRDIDSLPASISPIWLAKLRSKSNFSGIIIADDLQMDGIRLAIQSIYARQLSQLPTSDHEPFILQKSIIHALNAGNDMLIISNQLQEQPNLMSFCLKTVIQAVRRAEIAPSRLFDAYQRIQLIKTTDLPNLITS